MQGRIPGEIFISPHPDDAVWSCGGRIARLVDADVPVTVITVFDGDPPDPPPADPWRRIATPQRRRSENATALAELGARPLSVGLVDAALRMCRNVPEYSDPSQLFPPTPPKTGPMVESLIVTLRRLVPLGIRCNAPLGLGGHIDHLIVRDAVQAAGLAPVLWYEDFPYARTVEPDLGRLAAGAARRRALQFPVDLDRWIAAGLRYRSQVLALFGSGGRFREELTAHAAAAACGTAFDYAERCWISDRISEA